MHAAQTYRQSQHQLWFVAHTTAHAGSGTAQTQYLPHARTCLQFSRAVRTGTPAQRFLPRSVCAAHRPCCAHLRAVAALRGVAGAGAGGRVAQVASSLCALPSGRAAAVSSRCGGAIPSLSRGEQRRRRVHGARGSRSAGSTGRCCAAPIVPALCPRCRAAGRLDAACGWRWKRGGGTPGCCRREREPAPASNPPASPHNSTSGGRFRRTPHLHATARHSFM